MNRIPPHIPAYHAWYLEQMIEVRLDRRCSLARFSGAFPWALRRFWRSTLTDFTYEMPTIYSQLVAAGPDRILYYEPYSPLS